MDLLAQLKSRLASRYQIEREIGRGGMATVYLARDVRHARNVAVKVLNPELGAVLGAERFLSEIQVTANLQHPHLLPLFDSGEADGLLFYVMPYIQGESLRGKLQREKQLPIDEAMRLASSVLGALDYAHRHGVIHRDLKPENILLHEGQPLVADFGIALAVSNAGGERITQTGISLGTPHYMSPEQATGDRPIDQRSDVYSLGAVLYEALTGDPPHTASTAQGIIARVLTDTPRSVRATRPHVPPHVDAALTRALEKLPADRFNSANEFAQALIPGNTSAGVSLPSGVRTPGSFLRSPVPTMTRVSRSPVFWAAAFAAAVAVAVWQSVAARPRDDFAVKFDVGIPPNERIFNGTNAGRTLAISRDGKMIAFASSGGGNIRRVHVRAIDDVTPRPLPGTEGGSQLAFSPDGQWIAFIADQALKRVSTAGGPVTVLGEPGQTFGIDWGPSDQIVVSTGKQLLVMSGSGGAARVFAEADSTVVATLRWPRLLDDGKTVVLTWWSGGITSAKIAVTSIEGGPVRRLDVEGTSALGVMEGQLLYTTANAAIFAVPFDARSLKRTGPAQPVVDRVFVGGTGFGNVALSASGSLVYQSGTANSSLILVDTMGAARPLLPDVRGFQQPRYSPDGKLVAVATLTATSTDIHIYSIASGTLTRVTTDGIVNDRPEWSADGKRLLYRREVEDEVALWWQPVDLSEPAEVLQRGPNRNVWEGVLSPDGRTLVYRLGTIGSGNIYQRQLSGDTTSKALATTPFTEWSPRVSPDGKWVAYGSDDSRVMQVYVRPMAGGPRSQVSVDGGSSPVWSPDGQRLYYLNNQQMVMAVVRTTPAFAVVGRKKLFDGDFTDLPGHANYDISRDGKHFLMVRPSISTNEIIAIHNWRSELRRRVRSGVTR